MDIVSYLLGKQSSGGGGGGTTPTIGYTIDSYDTNGYPTKITTYGYTSIPEYMFYCYSQTVGSFKNLQEVSLNNGLTNLEQDVFGNCVSLQTVNNFETVTTIGVAAFINCNNLAITRLPNVATIGTGAFKYCASLKKLSMGSLVTTSASTQSQGNFSGCSSLKKVWIGSSVTNIGRYTFYNCSSLENIYIDLPRATVEAMANYQNVFGSTLSPEAIICNDDEGFITLEEFDDLVVS